MSQNQFGRSIWGFSRKFFNQLLRFRLLHYYQQQAILCWQQDPLHCTRFHTFPCLFLLDRHKRDILGGLLRRWQQVKFRNKVFTRPHTIIILRSFFGVFIALQSNGCTHVHLRVHRFVQILLLFRRQPMQEKFSFKESIAEFDNFEVVDIKDADNDPVLGTDSALPTPML